MPTAASVRRLVIGKPALRGDVALCLDAFELETARAAAAVPMAFDEAMDGGIAGAAERAEIRVPIWRGYRFLEVLDSLVRDGVGEGAPVSWETPRRVASGIARVLKEAGWKLERRREQDGVLLEGAAPAARSSPAPAAFTGELLGRTFRFAADWGVFSQDAVDPGTALLADVASGVEAESVADVGTGYGPLAIALSAARPSSLVVASEVDAVALSLARQNATANGVRVETTLTPDPLALPPTELTVCNFPTHAAPANRQALLAALEARGRGGSRLLLGCHRSLVSRFTGLAIGPATDVIERGEHAAVLY